MSKFFQVKNLDKYQHYKDRNPPWIKLYSDLLDNYEFACLQDASKLHLIFIWLLASRSGNRLPYDSGWIAKRINAISKVDLDCLLSVGFIEIISSDSALLAECTQSACPETETETETETDKEKNTKKENHKFSLPDDIDKSQWGEFMEVRKKLKAINSTRAMNGLINEIYRLQKLGHSPNDLIERSIRNSWKDIYEPKQTNGGFNGQQQKSSTERAVEATKRGLEAYQRQAGTS